MAADDGSLTPSDDSSQIDDDDTLAQKLGIHKNPPRGGKGRIVTNVPPVSGDDDDTLDSGGKDYKFTEVPANGSAVSYGASDTKDVPWGEMGGQKDLSQELEQVLGGVQNPKDLSPKEYQALTEQAQKGNTLAQKILVQGDYKAKAFPSLQQDLNKIDDPFVKALQGMPAMAENAQNQMNAVQQPYDFTNAEGQVNSLLGQMGSTMKMTSDPETTNYVNTLNSEVASAGNLNSTALGLPSIMDALGGLGPAAKESEKASPYASLLAALLSHQQYETIYGGTAPNSTGDPAWLQQLIQTVTGNAIGGGLVSPTVAAGGVGATPSTSSTPTGSNA